MYIVHHNIPDDCDSDYMKLKMKCMCYLFWDPTATDWDGGRWKKQTCFKIAGRDCAICWVAEGSKSCGHSAAPQSGRISSLIPNKFTPLLVIKIVNLHYQMQKTGQIRNIKCISKEVHLLGPLSALSHKWYFH